MIAFKSEKESAWICASPTPISWADVHYPRSKCSSCILISPFLKAGSLNSNWILGYEDTFVITSLVAFARKGELFLKTCPRPHESPPAALLESAGPWNRLRKFSDWGFIQLYHLPGDKLFPKTDSEDYPGLLHTLESTEVYQLEKKIKSEER